MRSRLRVLTVALAATALAGGLAAAPTATAGVPGVAQGAVATADETQTDETQTDPTDQAEPDATPSDEPTPDDRTDQGDEQAGRGASEAPSTEAAPTQEKRKQRNRMPKRGPAPDNYTPPVGVKFNYATGNQAQRRAILTHLIRTVNSVPGRNVIRVASWNIRSDAFVEALIRAHRRGVGVRVLLDRGNANPSNPNQGFNRLQSELRKYGNAKRKQFYRSYAKACVSSCRGPSGIAHSKFFLFSKAGSTKQVFINGSANATDLAASNQWNDVYTTRKRGKLYSQMMQVWNQMTKDRPVGQGYKTISTPPIQTYIFPYRGKGTGTDPVLRNLGDVSCANAGGVGTRGKTKIRIAMTSWHGDRGIKIAKRIRTMANRGCDVKIVYAVMGNEILRILRREGPRPVPLRQIVQDFNRDGVYDKYLHNKVLAIAGNYRGKKNMNVTFNGSQNWTPVSLVSDEVEQRITSKPVRITYGQYVDRLYANPPRLSRQSAMESARAERAVRARGIDPYMLIEEH